MYPAAYLSRFLLHVCLDPAAVLSIDYGHLVTAGGAFTADEVRQFEVGGNRAPRRSRTVSACL